VKDKARHQLWSFIWTDIIFSSDHQGPFPPADDISEELPDDDAAWKEATLIADDLFKDINAKFQQGQECGLEIKKRATAVAPFYRHRGRRMH
jgi:hypothetical protein